MRATSAIFIGLFTIVTGLLGGLWFTGLVFAVIAIASYEIVMMMRVSGFQLSLVFCFLVCMLSFSAVRFPGISYLPGIATLLFLASLIAQMRHRDSKPIADWAITIASGVYLGWTGGHLAAVRELNNGLWWLVMAIGTTWVADSGAYFVGTRFGRHQLAPRLSPKKTWEGYVGGVFTALLFGIVIGIWSPFGIAHSVLCALLVGALGTLGDLTESMFKRQAGVKDSGKLIPGHGGAFDRVDSLLWAGIVVYYYATLFVH